ncbi:BRCA1-associated protein [Cyathus striatus]|nr:BRCA1-associated protein [Cyathus striatus]
MRGYHILISLNRKTKESSSDFFYPTSLFHSLPAHPPKSTAKRRNTAVGVRNKDYRFGPIRVDWMDFGDLGAEKGSKVVNKQQRNGPAEATFVPLIHSKIGSTNLPEGVVHVFRDSASKPTQEELSANASVASIEPTDRDELMLGVLAVPSWMTPSDFLAFVAPAAEGIKHLRIIRDFAPNRSIAVIKFRNPSDASQFAEEYNGKPFNSLEPEICHVVHVLSVDIDAEDSSNQAVTRFGENSAYELPTCPVCLERMDSAVTGLITVPCSHTFHCMCLSKWGDSRCPVCRYSQTLLSSHPSSSASPRPVPFAHPAASPSSRCSACSSTTNLWICLICGNIGCGRYRQAHAQAHYQATTHLYALELETQRVWDYAGDGYVHRLIQNKADGKLVELPSAASSMGTSPRESGLGPTQEDALNAEKIEAIGIEYSYLLTSQLDSQRSYYEDQTKELKLQVNELRGLVENLSKSLDNERIRLREEQAQWRAEEESRVNELLKEKAKVEHRAENATAFARNLEKEMKMIGKRLNEEMAVSEGLLNNIGNLKNKLEEAEEEKVKNVEKMHDLEDQLRDLMFFLDANQKIEHGGGAEAEAAGGSVKVVPIPKKTEKRGR